MCEPKMLVFCVVLLLVRVAAVLSLTVPPPTSTSSQDIQVSKFEKLCDSKSKDVSHLMPWKEVALRAQGCTVPYYGPQGHGQFPEEVHIIQVMEVEKLSQSFPNEQQGLVSITIQLDASCENKTVSAGRVLSVSTELNSLARNNSDSHKDEGDTSKAKRSNIPMILKLQDMSLDGITSFIPNKKQSSSPDVTAYQTRRPLVLLLTSDQPVMWQIKPGVCWSKEVASKVQAMVERDSSVDSDIAVEVIPKTWTKKINRKSVQRFARRTYHGVASYTQIRAANLIRIIVGPRESTDAEKGHQLTFRNRNKLNFCDFSSREDSLVVKASLTVPLKAKCFVLGDSKEINTFIMEVQPEQTSGSEILRSENFPDMREPGIKSKSNITPITVHLSESKSAKISSSGKRTLTEKNPFNFTVILRSLQHTKWVLSSAVHSSDVNIVVDEGDDVLCTNLSGPLNISSLPLPKSRSDLLHKVMKEFASSVQYFQIDEGTGFTFTFANPIRQSERSQESNIFHRYLSSSMRDLSLTPSMPKPIENLNDADREKYILKILESEMVLICGASVFEIVLPAPVLIHLGVRALHLIDRSCQSHSNSTHFILSSSLTSCGSTSHTSGKASVISNSVYVDSSPLSSIDVNGAEMMRSLNPEMSQTGVPIACGLKQPLDDVVRSVFISSSDTVSEEEEDDSRAKSPQKSSSSSIYQLELYHKNVLTDALFPIKYRSVTDVTRRIYVQAWMNDAPSAQAVIESCWVSSLPHASVWLPNQKIVLLRGMCPVEKSVQLEKKLPQTKAFTFSFQILEEFSHLGEELYVHCQVGVCLSSLKHMKGKPVLCVDPQNYCLHLNPFSMSNVVLSTAHQLLTRGPILVSPLIGHTSAPELSQETKCTGSIFPYSSEISMEMTISIALFSFIIGIGLTATLWFIHNKTEPTHRAYHGREHSLGSQSAVLGSSLSPHSACSSTNSQSIITS